MFNRNDSQVKTDIATLDEAAFLEKHKGTTSDIVLRTVWKSGNKLVGAVPLPEPQVLHKKAYVTEDKTEVTIKKLDNGSVVIETDDKSSKANAAPKPGLKLEDNSGDGKITPGGIDKPGRTPRMRELITELGKDKAAVKAALDAEGFNTAGSGFHSEWNRVSKSM